MAFQKPRLVIAALRGGSGKTVVSLGLVAAWRKYRDLRIVPFKKGPDYIDAGWLATAAQHPCYNLDPFLMSSDEILSSFVHRAWRGDGSVIEGNRGLYDGMDVEGSYSTGELAKLLRAPVILVLDATKMTRTAAAMVLGCQHMDPGVQIAGVILNQVAGKRHERILRGSIERYCRIPVLGAIPKEKGSSFFPERHMGLIPPQEHGRIPDAVEFAASKMKECLDLEAIWQISSNAASLSLPIPIIQDEAIEKAEEPVVIGVVRDAAFQFYYPENLEELRKRGAILKEISSLENRSLPDVDALYIGGGFPETHLDILAGNTVFRESVRKAVENGLPIYAECGGLMFLCRGIYSSGSMHPMVGIFPFDVILEAKPQGHGYTILESVQENPYFPRGTVFRGHEFHYSRIVSIENSPSVSFVFRLQKGHGIVAGWDGLCYKNTLANYSHLHVVGNEHWAKAMVKAASRFRQSSLKGINGIKDPKAGRKPGASEMHAYLTAS